MLPSNTKYPMFQPDQLLTSDNLNNLFGYLEEQGRLTRTNLIGMGIVCGLDVKTSTDGASITITKGCGITSEGYLVEVPEITYTYYKQYDATKQLVYDRFAGLTGDDLLQLMETATEENTIAINTIDLSTKVVILYVEVLQEGAKNCDPNSCDDKGVNVTISFIPILIDQANVSKLAGTGATTPIAGNQYLNLAEVKMKKVDVPASTLSTASAIFQAYLNVISPVFLTGIENTLGQLYNTFKVLFSDAYPSNPFTGLADSFSFLHDNTLTSDQLVSIQYFYDLFSDVIYAYEELRKTGMQVLSDCCPDGDPFPRHLILSQATASASTTKLAYRSYFTPSPILDGGCCGGSLSKLKSLFTRLVLMLEKFTITPSTQNITIPRRFFDNKILFRSKGPVIRITPSKYGDLPLSKKAIPYYYNVTNGTDKLYTYWNYDKTLIGRQSKNLSYHAPEYNTMDEFVTTPLLYDLEEYNFLRIEGHIGMPYAQALQGIQDLKNQYRLPFQTLALSGDINQLKQQINNLTKLNAATGLADSLNIDPDDVTCQFQDMEALYDALSAELIGKLCMEMEYLYNQDGNAKLGTPASTVPQVPLLKDNDADFRFIPNSFGHQFENYYATIKNQAYISADVFLGTFNYSLRELSSDQRFVRAQQNSNTTGFALLYHMEKLYEALTEDLTDFDIDTFDTRYDDFMRIANAVKDIVEGNLEDSFTSINTAAGAPIDVADDDTFKQEDLIDHLDDLIYLCKKPQFDALYKDYISRWLSVLMLQRFGYFITKHPGISHKAGVTMGGTFIIVYHEQATTDSTITTGAAAGGFSLTDLDKLTETGRVSSGIVNEIKAGGGIANKVVNIDRLGITADKEITEEKAVPRMEMRMATETDATTESEAADPVAEAALDPNIKLTRTNLSGIFSGTFKNTITGLLNPVNIPPVLATQNLDDIIADIADGTVIADFYLPYLCYSDCPPVNFIINNPVPPTPVPDPTIAISPVAYCIENTGTYALTVTPAGGVVTGEGTQDAIFIPSQVIIEAGATKKDVTLTYTANSKAAIVVVTVYAKPIASFTTATPNASAPLTIQFNNKSAFADSFSWNIDGTLYHDESPLVTFKDQGTYTATLTVTNGPCTSEPVSQQVVIQTQVPPVTLKCMPLASIVNDFQTLDKFEGTIPFKKEFESYQAVADLFTKIDGDKISSRAASVQIKFFIEMKVAANLPLWLRPLDGLIESSNVSTSAITLFRILSDLAMYISCIQQEDLGKEQIDMQPSFDIIGKLLPNYVSMFGSNTDVRGEQLNQLRADLTDEKARIDKTNTPEYFNTITTLLNIWGVK